MKFDVYCDESCSEVLFDREAHKYFLLGGLWIPTDFRVQFKTDIKAIRVKYNYGLEIKWNKVSPKFLDTYKALVEYFFSKNELRFRALIIESQKLDLIKYHSGDAELSFYKFYYQLLHHWILDFNEYNIFLDFKVNKERSRLKILKDILSNSSLSSIITNLQSVHSTESLGIQISDFLLGSVNAKYNTKIKSNGSKSKIISLIESNLGYPICQTSKTENKFNIFNLIFKVEGGSLPENPK